ncbi:MAG: metallophosphoesterase family protein [Xanthobacteraceae bacterium]|jgi:diadenosine tetraphosphatase ApaH/serine/threonine PP2A family protein phosphatase
MLIALFADIHANRQAFAACLARARERGAARIVLLGDYVGYGADPDWTVTTVMDLVGQGALAVRGNHDNAVSEASETLNIEAKIVIEWTRNELGSAERRFLKELPLTLNEDDRFYVHSEASKPSGWRYINSVADAARSIEATSARITFCGHNHRPQLYTVGPKGSVTAFTPISGSAIPLLPGRRWLAVLGSVGQPRDGNPSASYAVLDTDRHELTYCRAPYDVEEAAARIRKSGLPIWLADRLAIGQ